MLDAFLPFVYVYGEIDILPSLKKRKKTEEGNSAIVTRLPFYRKQSNGPPRQRPRISRNFAKFVPTVFAPGVDGDSIFVFDRINLLHNNKT